MKLYSYDVFDTIITRKTRTPQGIFALMQESLVTVDEYADIPAPIRYNFACIRTYGQDLAIKSASFISKREEATLREIYECINCHYRLTEEMIHRLMELETKIEYEQCIKNPEMVSEIESLCRNGKRVVLISDMYMEKEIIQKMIRKAAPELTDIPLYVSSAYGKNKASGELYRIIREIENVSYMEWRHKGDDEHSDYSVPKQLGIHAVLYRKQQSKENVFQYKDCLYEAWNKKHEQVIRENGLLHLPHTPYEIGIAAGGPLLYCYTSWIISHCLEQKINRLYFIARDGYILKMIADKIISVKKLNIKTYYIYGSRRTWRLPSIGGKQCHVEDIIRWSYPEKIDSIQALADMFEITTDQLKPFIIPLTVKSKWQLPYSYINALLTQLIYNKEFEAFLKKHFKKKRDNALAYIQQEVDVSDESFAFVELGGHGYTQACLSDIMEGLYKKRIKTFYFKMDHINIFKNCINYVLFPSILPYHLIIEMVCRAPHGQTIGYQNVNGKIVPIIEEHEEKAYKSYGYCEYIDGIMAYCEKIIKKESGKTLDLVSIAFVHKHMEAVGANPSPEIMDFFGDMPNSISGREQNIQVYAPRLSDDDIENIYYYGQRDPIWKYYKGSDLEYSFLRLSEAQKGLVNYYKQKEYPQEKEGSNHYEFLPDKLIVYGAGKRGRKLIMDINWEKSHTLVTWVDAIYDRHIDGIKIQNPMNIKKYDYDAILVAIVNENIYKDIHINLLEMGVNERKILWFY